MSNETKNEKEIKIEMSLIIDKIAEIDIAMLYIDNAVVTISSVFNYHKDNSHHVNEFIINSLNNDLVINQTKELLMIMRERYEKKMQELNNNLYNLKPKIKK